MKLLGIAGIAVLTVVIGSMVLPVFAGEWSQKSDEGRALSEATGATMRQAGDVGKSFGSLIPASAEAAVQEDSDTSVQNKPEPPDSSDHPAEAGDDIQHEVAAALAALASVDTGRGDVATDERVIAIENLRDIWSPRYRQAEEEHRRLVYRIEHADRAAKRYFSVQTDLTGHIKSREERRRAEASDRAEMEVYEQWSTQAHQTLNQADRIMDDLHDMDIRITKQLLSANFTSVYRDFLELPIAISQLHRDLEQFRIRSDEIGATFHQN